LVDTSPGEAAKHQQQTKDLFRCGNNASWCKKPAQSEITADDFRDLPPAMSDIHRIESANHNHCCTSRPPAPLRPPAPSPSPRTRRRRPALLGRRRRRSLTGNGSAVTTCTSPGRCSLTPTLGDRILSALHWSRFFGSSFTYHALHTDRAIGAASPGRPLHSI
jgi:hypothetical protein